MDFYVELKGLYVLFQVSDLLSGAYKLLFQKFKTVCKNIGNSWRNQTKPVEK